MSYRGHTSVRAIHYAHITFVLIWLCVLHIRSVNEGWIYIPFACTHKTALL